MTEPRLGQAFAYANPVVRGNAPDPSVIRVGTNYFLATSSFEYLPGIVIRHSTDLVSWQIIGAAITRPAQYRRDGRPGHPLPLPPPPPRPRACERARQERRGSAAGAVPPRWSARQHHAVRPDAAAPRRTLLHR